MTLLRQLRKAILGETWQLPLGIAVALGIAAAVREMSGAGGWWEESGGLVLGALLVVALALALPRRH